LLKEIIGADCKRKQASTQWLSFDIICLQQCLHDIPGATALRIASCQKHTSQVDCASCGARLREHSQRRIGALKRGSFWYERHDDAISRRHSHREETPSLTWEVDERE